MAPNNETGHWGAASAAAAPIGAGHFPTHPHALRNPSELPPSLVGPQGLCRVEARAARFASLRFGNSEAIKPHHEAWPRAWPRRARLARSSSHTIGESPGEDVGEGLVELAMCNIVATCSMSGPVALATVSTIGAVRHAWRRGARGAQLISLTPPGRAARRGSALRSQPEVLRCAK